MVTKEKNLEQDIESYLLNEGGYVKGNMGQCKRNEDKIRILQLPTS